MNKIPDEYRTLTESIIGAAIEVHCCLGPGLLESCYTACLAHELAQRAIPFTKEVHLPVAYKEIRLDCGYRMDFVVSDLVLIELKSVDDVTNVHVSQVLTYM